MELYEGTPPPDSKNVVVNTEWGGFGNTGSLDIIRTHYDHELDAQSRNPGRQVYEKLISGMYLGELARMVMVHAIREGVMFSGRAAEALAVLGKRDAFLSRFVSELEADPNR